MNTCPVLYLLLNNINGVTMKNLEYKFIKGPVWCDWLAKASSLGLSTGLVGNALWFYAGIEGSAQFKIDSMVGKLTGLSRQTISSSLKQLANAGLIGLYPKRGSYPTVHIYNNMLSRKCASDPINSS
jgi:hypothetical protein